MTSWLIENTAPCGSWITALRKPELSNGGAIAVPPCAVTTSTVRSTSETWRFTIQSVESAARAAPSRRPRPAGSAGATGRRRSRAGGTGSLAERLGLPAEERAIERRGGVRVVGVQRAHLPRPRLVDQLRAFAIDRLPDREHRLRGIGDHRDPAGGQRRRTARRAACRRPRPRARSPPRRSRPGCRCSRTASPGWPCRGRRRRGPGCGRRGSRSRSGR